MGKVRVFCLKDTPNIICWREDLFEKIVLFPFLTVTFPEVEDEGVDEEYEDEKYDENGNDDMREDSRFFSFFFFVFSCLH